MKKTLFRLSTTVLLLFGCIIISDAQESAFGALHKSKVECKNCNSAASPLIKDDGYCGYVVQYDPCGNCTRIYKHNCNFKNHCWPGYYLKAGNDCEWKLVRQVRVGAPVQLYVNNLNFLKYNFSAESSSILIDSGDAGLFSLLSGLLEGSMHAALSSSKYAAQRDTCPQRKQYDTALLKLQEYQNGIQSLIKDFSNLFNGINNSAYDCSSGSLVVELRSLLEELNTKGDYAGILFSPKDAINIENRRAFDAFYNEMDSLTKAIGEKNSNPDCNNLLYEIEEKIKQSHKQDTLIGRLAEALGKIYPLPDFEYQYNVPQVKNVDYLVFKLNLKGKENNRNYRLNMKDEEIQIPVKGGMRIDFTTGPFMSFFNETAYGLKPDSIYSKTKPDSAIRTGTRIVSQNKGNIPHFGIATMLQIYPRLFPNVCLAPCIGIGINTDLSYSFLAGGSIILGREQRVSLNFGYSCNFTKQLSSANNVGDFESADYTIKTVSTYKSGFFISLCYNIGLSSKKSNTQTANPFPSDNPNAAPTTNKNPTNSGGNSKEKK